MSKSQEMQPEHSAGEPPDEQPFAWVRDDRPEGVPLISFRPDKPTVPGADAWFPLYRASQPPGALIAAADRLRETARAVPEYANELLVSREIVGKLALELSRHSLTKGEG